MQEGDYSLQCIRVKYNIVAMKRYVSLNALCDRSVLSKPEGFGKMPDEFAGRRPLLQTVRVNAQNYPMCVRRRGRQVFRRRFVSERLLYGRAWRLGRKSS